MDIATARTWLITASLGITGAIFTFFAIAPAVGYPLDWAESFRMLEIVLPVFVGYLGSATYFVFNRGRQNGGQDVAADHPYLGLLIKGPIFVWGLGSLAAIAGFGYSNRIASGAGESHMSVEILAALMAAGLSLLTVTTNVAVAYLFGSADRTVSPAEATPAEPAHQPPA